MNFTYCSDEVYGWEIWLSLYTVAFSHRSSSCACPSLLHLAIIAAAISIVRISIITLLFKSCPITTTLNTDGSYLITSRKILQVKSFSTLSTRKFWSTLNAIILTNKALGISSECANWARRSLSTLSFHENIADVWTNKTLVYRVSNALSASRMTRLTPPFVIIESKFTVTFFSIIHRIIVTCLTLTPDPIKSSLTNTLPSIPIFLLSIAPLA